MWFSRSRLALLRGRVPLELETLAAGLSQYFAPDQRVRIPGYERDMLHVLGVKSVQFSDWRFIGDDAEARCVVLLGGESEHEFVVRFNAHDATVRALDSSREPEVVPLFRAANVLDQGRATGFAMVKEIATRLAPILGYPDADTPFVESGGQLTTSASGFVLGTTIAAAHANAQLDTIHPAAAKNLRRYVDRGLSDLGIRPGQPDWRRRRDAIVAAVPELRESVELLGGRFNARLPRSLRPAGDTLSGWYVAPRAVFAAIPPLIGIITGAGQDASANMRQGPRYVAASLVHWAKETGRILAVANTGARNAADDAPNRLREKTSRPVFFHVHGTGGSVDAGSRVLITEQGEGDGADRRRQSALESEITIHTMFGGLTTARSAASLWQGGNYNANLNAKIREVRARNEPAVQFARHKEITEQLVLAWSILYERARAELDDDELQMLLADAMGRWVEHNSLCDAMVPLGSDAHAKAASTKSSHRPFSQTFRHAILPGYKALALTAPVTAAWGHPEFFLLFLSRQIAGDVLHAREEAFMRTREDDIQGLAQRNWENDTQYYRDLRMAMGKQLLAAHHEGPPTAFEFPPRPAIEYVPDWRPFAKATLVATPMITLSVGPLFFFESLRSLAYGVVGWRMAEAAQVYGRQYFGMRIAGRFRAKATARAEKMAVQRQTRDIRARVAPMTQTAKQQVDMWLESLTEATDALSDLQEQLNWHEHEQRAAKPQKFVEFFIDDEMYALSLLISQGRRDSSRQPVAIPDIGDINERRYVLKQLDAFGGDRRKLHEHLLGLVKPETPDLAELARNRADSDALLRHLRERDPELEPIVFLSTWNLPKERARKSRRVKGAAKLVEWPPQSEQRLAAALARLKGTVVASWAAPLIVKAILQSMPPKPDDATGAPRVEDPAQFAEHINSGIDFFEQLAADVRGGEDRIYLDQWADFINYAVPSWRVSEPKNERRTAAEANERIAAAVEDSLARPGSHKTLRRIFLRCREMTEMRAEHRPERDVRAADALTKKISEDTKTLAKAELCYQAMREFLPEPLSKVEFIFSPASQWPRDESPKAQWGPPTVLNDQAMRLAERLVELDTLFVHVPASKNGGQGLLSKVHSFVRTPLDLDQEGNVRAQVWAAAAALGGVKPHPNEPEKRIIDPDKMCELLSPRADGASLPGLALQDVARVRGGHSLVGDNKRRRRSLKGAARAVRQELRGANDLDRPLHTAITTHQADYRQSLIRRYQQS
ncbi:MAG: hypothetical protein HOQ05_08245 [Corynebacteriales bacterium]|nr:hypothetical protein [Mycobacteriales bacterium]